MFFTMRKMRFEFKNPFVDIHTYIPRNAAFISRSDKRQCVEWMMTTAIDTQRKERRKILAYRQKHDKQMCRYEMKWTKSEKKRLIAELRVIESKKFIGILNFESLKDEKNQR